MKITTISLFPQTISGFTSSSILGRANSKKIVSYNHIDLRDYGEGIRKTTDDRPYGGGAGMLMMIDSLVRAIKEIKNKNNSSFEKVILTSARGKIFNQKKAKEFSKLKHIVIIAGHYEGVDERINNYIDEEISIGDFVLTGGEIATVMIIDSVVRLLPGVLDKKEAIQEESFYKVSVLELLKLIPDDITLIKLQKRNINHIQLLEYPQYTRPENYKGKKVPVILLSGDHEKIRIWRLTQAYLRTKLFRPDLLQI